MIEAQVELWEEPADVRCITTNGFVKANGKLVMGAGTAGQAEGRYPGLPAHWGAEVKADGNHVGLAHVTEGILVRFPVKHVWYDKADLELIERSSRELMELADRYSNWKKILLPRPGCGHGQLTWAQVKPVIEPILDDRVWVIWNGRGPFG